MNKKEKEIIKSTIAELLKKLLIEAEFEIEEKEEASIEVVLNTEDSGIVIGRHGDTLEALQLIMSLCIYKKLEKFVRVSVEVGDYKKNRIEWLKNLALEAKERAASQGREIVLSELKSWERRIIHLILQDDEKVVSQSQGEGKSRVLVISPKH